MPRWVVSRDGAERTGVGGSARVDVNEYELLREEAKNQNLSWDDYLDTIMLNGTLGELERIKEGNELEEMHVKQIVYREPARWPQLHLQGFSPSSHTDRGPAGLESGEGGSEEFTSSFRI